MNVQSVCLHHKYCPKSGNHSWWDRGTVTNWIYIRCCTRAGVIMVVGREKGFKSDVRKICLQEFWSKTLSVRETGTVGIRYLLVPSLRATEDTLVRELTCKSLGKRVCLGRNTPIPSPNSPLTQNEHKSRSVAQSPVWDRLDSAGIQVACYWGLRNTTTCVCFYTFYYDTIHHEDYHPRHSSFPDDDYPKGNNECLGVNLYVVM